MNRKVALSLLCGLWVFMLLKTILAMNYHDLTPTAHFYGIMLDNTWQAHFNVDLLTLSMVFAGWMLYRAKSKVNGLLCALGAIYFGAIFTLLYLIVVLVKSAGDMEMFFRGDKRRLTYNIHHFDP